MISCSPRSVYNLSNGWLGFHAFGAIPKGPETINLLPFGVKENNEKLYREVLNADIGNYISKCSNCDSFHKNLF